MGRLALLMILHGSVPALHLLHAQATEYKTPTDSSTAGMEDSRTDRRPFLPQIYPEDLKPVLQPGSLAPQWAGRHRLEALGWLDGGASTISHASGQVIEAPVSNRFSNQFMLNAAWLSLSRSPKGTNPWGFRTDFYAGSDPALLRPRESFGPQGARWGTDVRQVYLTVHTSLSAGKSIDFAGGRLNVPTGFESLMGPYRPIYSQGYFWIHYETASTALQATLHPSSTLDVVGGVDLGYNTYFTLRGRSPSYFGRLVFRPEGQKATQWLATVYTGPEPVAAQAGHVGTWQTLTEIQMRKVWKPRLAQVVQGHYGLDVRDQANTGHDSHTQGAFLITIIKLDGRTFVNSRLEWFADPSGIRTVKPGSYGEATVNVAFLPKRSVEIRPEVRGDFAGQRSFGSVEHGSRYRNQLSIGCELLLKFKLFQ